MRKNRRDWIERAIERKLSVLARNADEIEDTDAAWTHALKNSLALLGESLGFVPYASQCEAAHDGEWLYDLVWIEEDEWLRRIPLVVESEWKPDGIWDDFEKLLVARADHRLMVLWATTEDGAEETIDELIEGIDACEMTERGDRYLFACWVDELDQFVSVLYVA